MTKFAKGNTANLAGRPKGSLGRFRIDVGKILRDNNFCPILEMVKIALQSEKEENRIACCKEIAKYAAPQLKAMEVTGEDGKAFKFVVNIAPKDFPRETIPKSGAPD